jgi:hypothetical protein
VNERRRSDAPATGRCCLVAAVRTVTHDRLDHLWWASTDVFAASNRDFPRSPTTNTRTKPTFTRGEPDGRRGAVFETGNDLTGS